MPERRSGSHPVPDHPLVRRRLQEFRARAAAAPIPTVAGRLSLTSDRINYLVGETPVYQIDQGPADQPVEWTINRAGQEPIAWSDPAQRTDALGRWTGEGGTWTRDLTGFYTIEAHVAGLDARTSFNVTDALPKSPEPRATAANLIGVVHVAGDYRFAGPGTPFGDVPFLVEGAQLILNLGARRGFFYLTPQYKSSDYPFDDFGPVPIETLTGLADSAPYRMLFGLPFDEFVLTTYTFANWQWALDRALGGTSVPFVAASETSEIAELVSYLAAKYPTKDFVVKNWEGDWQLQENFEINSVPTPERVQEGIAWMRARQAGVVQGRATAGVQNVRHAIEFNLLSHSVRDEPGMLSDVIRDADSDLISYSSWETSNLFDTRRMKDALAYLQGLPASKGRQVLIGEFGQRNDPPDPEAGAHVEAMLRAFVDTGTQAFFWEIFNNGVPFGLIGPDFRHSLAWFTLRDALGAKNAAKIVEDPALTEAPPFVEAGESVRIKLTFENTGQTWHQAAIYQLELLGPGREDLIALLPHDVPASGRVTFEFDWTAPSAAGVYQLQLAQRGIELFGDTVSIEVRAGSHS